MYYPSIDDCCYCCNSAQGCGVLKPDWIVDGAFMGTATVSGVQTYQWNKHGGQDNYYFETIDADPLKRIPIKIDQGVDSTNEWIQW